MSLKISYALISAVLLFGNAACTQKRDVKHGLSEEGTPAPAASPSAKANEKFGKDTTAGKVPVNTDKAAGFEKKESDINKDKESKDAPAAASAPAVVEGKDKAAETKSVTAVNATIGTAPATVAEKKEPFAWKIPVKPAKAAATNNAPGTNNGPGVPKPQASGTAQGAPQAQAQQAAPAQEEAKTPVDYSSEAIKREAFAKISFENLEDLVAQMKNPDAVVYRGKVVSEKFMAEKIKTLNEESYCKVSFKGDVRKSDFFRLDIESLSSTPVDTAHVVNIFKANYKNTAGEVLLTCTHTTSNFFMQAAQLDFAKWITFYEFAGNKIETAGYKNPLTEERKIDAVKIQDMEKFKKAVNDDSAKDSFALLKGEIIDMAEGYSAVATQKDTQSCIINEVAGTATKDLVYIRVAKGILEPTPQENPNANMYVTYRADAENFFIMSCYMAKTERWTKLMDTTKGVLQFGAMDRITLMKKGPEIQKIQDDYEATFRK